MTTPGAPPPQQPQQPQQQQQQQYPQQPQQQQYPQQPHSPTDGMHLVADTVGLVPNVRKKDNLYQGAIVGGGTLLLTLVGYLVSGVGGALLGALVGLIGLGLLTGLVIMVLGWKRTAERKRL